MASITPLAYTDLIDNGQAPIKTDLTGMFDEFQTFINDELVDNLVIATNSSYGSGVGFPAISALTSNLYNKQTIEEAFTGGDFTLSTTGAWTDVDASNASITITPELAGDFNATFQFSVECISSNATNAVDIRFRLTDGSDASYATPRVKLITGVTGTTNVVPVNLKHQFSTWAASAQTVKLQYFITTLTNATVKVYANSNDNLYMQVEKI